jgi:sugar O-acyltransferase (sialic acid O-acetyltransferase NeuD family)
VRLAIFGAGGHGLAVASVASQLSWSSISFYDSKNMASNFPNKYSFCGQLDDLLRDIGSYDGFFVAIGDNDIRSYFFQRFFDLKLPLVNIISPSATVNPDVEVGQGCLVMPNSVINNDVSLGNGVIINSSVIVEHNCIISDFVHLAPGCVLGGSVSIGKYSFLGLNSTVKNGLNIGESVTVGAGSVVLQDQPSNSISFGVPAKART